MNYPLVREKIAPGVYFSSITDKKFKHNRMSVNLIVKLDRQKVTNRAVVPFILRQGSKSCPDFAVLNQRLCDLYGASLDAGIDKFGDYQIIALGIVGIDSRFALENFHPLRFQWQTKKDSSWHIKGSTNTDWQQRTWLCYARTGKGKNLRVQRRKRSFLPFASVRYNTSAPHGGRNGNSDGRATEVRKPEEKVCFLMR